MAHIGSGAQPPLAAAPSPAASVVAGTGDRVEAMSTMRRRRLAFEETVGADVLDFADDDINYDDEDSQTERFHANELVEHSKFGLGRVKEFLDMGEDSIVVVRFNSGLTKSLMIKYAKLTRSGR